MIKKPIVSVMNPGIINRIEPNAIDAQILFRIKEVYSDKYYLTQILLCSILYPGVIKAQYGRRKINSIVFKAPTCCPTFINTNISIAGRPNISRKNEFICLIQNYIINVYLSNYE